MQFGDLIEDENVLAPSASAMRWGLSAGTEAMLDTLTSREGKMLAMHFGIGMSSSHVLEEVGKQFNVTRERIRQIEPEALGKLRHGNWAERLRTYLEP